MLTKSIQDNHTWIISLPDQYSQLYQARVPLDEAGMLLVPGMPAVAYLSW